MNKILPFIFPIILFLMPALLFANAGFSEISKNTGNYNYIIFCIAFAIIAIIFTIRTIRTYLETTKTHVQITRDEGIKYFLVVMSFYIASLFGPFFDKMLGFPHNFSANSRDFIGLLGFAALIHYLNVGRISKNNNSIDA